MVAKAQEGLGRLDILVNGAGINIRRPADTFTEADYDHLMDVNLKSAFFTSIEAGRVMRSAEARAHHQHRIADLRVRGAERDALRDEQGRHEAAHQAARARVGARTA